MVEWEILGGEVFINFNPDNNNVVYLTNEAWMEKDNPGSSELKEIYEDSSSYINVVHWGKGPKKEDFSKKSYQAPSISTNKSYRLHFG